MIKAVFRYIKSCLTYALYESFYSKLKKVGKSVVFALMIVLTASTLILEYVALNMIVGGSGKDIIIAIILIIVCSALGLITFRFNSCISRAALKAHSSVGKNNINAHPATAIEPIAEPEEKQVLNQTQPQQPASVVSETKNRSKLDLTIGIVGIFLTLGLVAGVFVVFFTAIKN